MVLESRKPCFLGKYSAAELYRQLIYFHFEFQLSYRKPLGALCFFSFCVSLKKTVHNSSPPIGFCPLEPGPLSPFLFFTPPDHLPPLHFPAAGTGSRRVQVPLWSCAGQQGLSGLLAAPKKPLCCFSPLSGLLGDY